MAFVNEYVPEEDVKKYGLERINLQYRKTDIRYRWTIDRKRDVYLRWLGGGREEFCDQQDFTLYWKGTLIFVRLRVIDAGGERGGEGWTRWALQFLNCPEELQAKRSEIIADLKEALTAYKGSGVSSTFTKYTATFEF
jgi:hypothetical protein